MPLEFQVNVPNQNTIKYEVVEDGVWAYIKEIPTTRVFAKTEDDACMPAFDDANNECRR